MKNAILQNNVYADGCTITRENGSVVHLSGSEVAFIQRCLWATWGKHTLEWYIEGKEYDITDADEADKPVLEAQKEAAIRLLDKPEVCYNIFDTYYENCTYDTSEYEFDAAEYEVNLEMENK